MRPLVDMDTIQIEITNACGNSCSNCTRFCGHYSKPYFMTLDKVKEAIDSLVDFPNMVGIMGGEPLLHPKFEEICEYLQIKIPRERCGLWTTLPEGKEKYRVVIVKTFGNILLNDHTRKDILHAPVLVPSEELNLEQWQKDYLINKCWVQNDWSASINEKGAWFCEIAGALATLLEVDDLAWPIEPKWWTRSPCHFVKQMEMCRYCGCAMPLKKRCSTDVIDDISLNMYNRLNKTSPKLKKGNYKIHDLSLCHEEEGPIATYKDDKYRDAIAKRYGMFLMYNKKKFQTPYLLRNYN